MKGRDRCLSFEVNINLFPCEGDASLQTRQVQGPQLTSLSGPPD